MTETPFPILVGWDSAEDIAYQVCRHSILARASVPVRVTPIKQDELRERGLYGRERDPLASTEFTYTRFLVPHLAGYDGWALFCDCDFLWLADIKGLIDLIGALPETGPRIASMAACVRRHEAAGRRLA
jgi:hypothetical protein